MIEKLLQLGFSKKEAVAYLALLEFGTQPASVIAKKTTLPKATVLFLFENLAKRGYIRKSKKGRTQYFFADPADLESATQQELTARQQTLKETIPLLKEFRTPYSSEPKVTFFEGLQGCRKAYSLILQSSTEVCEFAAHDDLMKMGNDFMNEFMQKRAQNKVFINVVCANTELHKKFRKLNKQHRRAMKAFSPKQGALHSSIAIFENKVLLLNLYHDAFAILIENEEVAQTLRTIHTLVWNGKQVA